MPYYWRRNSMSGVKRQYYKTERNKEYNKKKTDYIKANDKLKMLGILFTAAYRAVEDKGIRTKQIRVFLYEEPENHDFNDEKNYDRIYYNISIDKVFFKEESFIRTFKTRRRSKRKSQIVKV